MSPATLIDLPWTHTSYVVLALYYLVLGTLAAYGCHRLLLVIDFYRSRGRTPAEPPAPDPWPLVTVQLPIFNERFVAERLIEAVVALDYPRECLQIQVLDDSTDETRELVANLVARWREKGVAIEHLHREDRQGYKAGALAAGLATARGDLLAIFDADFVPTPDFLKRTVPYFAAPDLGMVQARWGHINREYSLLTRVQAMLLDGHFVIEHAARHRTGCLFNFNGTAGIWRRQAILDAGGWAHDTLTEDLDLSYRAQMAGWRFHYLPDVVVPAELPVEINAYKSQQHRWAMGSIQTCRKLLTAILKAPLSARAKLEAFVHLTANGTYPLMLALSLLIFPAMFLRRGDHSWKLLIIDLPLFGAATLAISLFFLASQRSTDLPWWRAMARLPALMAVGIGLAVNNTRAVWRGLRVDGGVFQRTPKFRIESVGQVVKATSYRMRADAALLFEILLGAYFLVCFAAAAVLEMWWSMPFLWLFLQGYLYVAILGLASRRARG